MYFYYICLWFFARKYLKKNKAFVIWINGSVWKTSCRMIISQTLEKYLIGKKIYTSSKNFNGELWMSLSVFCIEQREPTVYYFVKTFFYSLFMAFFWKKKYDVVVLEYGIDRPWEMDFLLKIKRPDIGVFTAIDSVHSMQFWNPANIALEESKMVRNTTQIAFLNESDSYAMQLFHELQIDKFSYQTQWQYSDCDIVFWDEKYILTKDKKVNVDFDLTVKERKYWIKTNVFGKPHYGYIWVWLVITDILFYKYFKKSLFDQLDMFELEYNLLPGRMSFFSGINGSVILDSTYNASPLSVKKTIDSALVIKRELFTTKPFWVVLWDMRELWDFTESEHRKICAYLQSVADRIFLVGESTKSFVVDELSKIGYDMERVKHFDNSLELWKSLINDKDFIDSSPFVLVKGSQNTIFLEEVVKMLLADKKDIKYLVRQSKWWLNTKNKFFDLID